MGYAVWMRIDGVDAGGDGDRRGWMEICSFNHNVAAGSERQDHPPQLDFSIVRYADSASPRLAQAACEGRHFPEAVLQCVRADRPDGLLYEVRLKDVAVLNYSVSGGPPADAPSPFESLSLRFARVDWTFFGEGKEAARGRWNPREEAVAR